MRPLALLVLLSLLSAPAVADPTTSEQDELRSLHRRFVHLSRELERLVEGSEPDDRAERFLDLDRRLHLLASRSLEVEAEGAESLRTRIRQLRRRALLLEAREPREGPRSAGVRFGRVFWPPALSSRASAAPADECSMAPAIGLGNHDVLVSPAFSPDGDASCSFEPIDSWVRFVAAAAGWYQFAVEDPEGDVALSLHSGCPGTTANEIACEDSHPNAPIGLELEAGASVLLRLALRDHDDEHVVELRAAPATGLAGRVVDLAGAPLRDAEVCAESVIGSEVGCARADIDGHYAIFGLPPGTYSVLASVNGRVSETWPDTPCSTGDCLESAARLFVAPNQVLEDIDFDLGPGATLGGRISKMSNGRPFDDGIVEVLTTEGEPVASDYCCSDEGRWEVSVVPPGQFLIRLEADFPEGEQTLLWNGVPCPDGQCDLQEGTVLDLGHGDEITDIDFVVDDSGACLEDSETLCIEAASHDARFRITTRVESDAGGGLDFVAKATPLRYIDADSGGLFSFFDRSNPEILVKVLDGCALNGHYWVFSAAATSLGFELRVEDTVTGHEKTYSSPDGTPAPTITDTLALPCL